LAGDSLGGLVEFSSAAKIKSKYPSGLRDLIDGGHWHILAGQPTDDSELALMLARSIVQAKGYDPAAALDAYLHWYSSPPFDIGGTTSSALRGAKHGKTPQDRVAGAKQHASTSSQANGSLMRISPLGIFGAGNPAAAADWARADSSLTHPHEVCQDSCAVFVAAIATAIAAGCSAEACYQAALAEARRSSAADPVAEALREAAERPPDDYQTQQGWVLIALQNAFYQLLHARAWKKAWCGPSWPAATRTPTPPSPAPCWAPSTTETPSRRSGAAASCPAAHCPSPAPRIHGPSSSGRWTPCGWPRSYW
jgi:ADP-ribosyl-[dinitrogen reductase] hydrolase